MHTDLVLETPTSPGAPVTGNGTEWVTIQQLSEEIGVKQVTIRSWIRRGTGPPHYKLNNLVRFRRVDLDEWLAKRRRIKPRRPRKPKVAA